MNGERGVFLSAMNGERGKLEDESRGISDTDKVEVSDVIVEKPASRTDAADLLTTDLIMEIFKRLPVKTLARFLCVSKLWASSIIRSRYFRKLFLAGSSNRRSSFSFDKPPFTSYVYSSHQTRNSGETSVATYHMTLSVRDHLPNSSFPSVHGLIFRRNPPYLKVYNPSTRRSITLPKFHTERLSLYHYLGYDPIDDDYKILSIAQDVQVLTIGNGNQWRMIENCPTHSPRFFPHICIDGVLYYGAYIRTRFSQVIMSFDVRSEIFDVIKAPPEVGEGLYEKMMTRYNGKLTLMSTKFDGFISKIELWVLEDAVKHEWSFKVLTLPSSFGGLNYSLQALCAIDETGEFVLAPRDLKAPPFYVMYYDPEKKSIRRVNIEGITEYWDDSYQDRPSPIFLDQVENLMFL